MRVGGECIETTVICSTIFHPQMCTSLSTILYERYGTDCIIPLYRNP